MAVFTFSTQDSRKPKDAEMVAAVKAHCDKHRLNFSAVVVSLLAKYKEEIDEQKR